MVIFSFDRCDQDHKFQIALRLTVSTRWSIKYLSISVKSFLIQPILADCPPSTGRATPVMNLASSEARNKEA